MTKDFPLDRLKIDRSFVSGIDRIPANAIIVKAIVALAEALRLEVIAEGVGTPRRNWNASNAAAAANTRVTGCRSRSPRTISRAGSKIQDTPEFLLRSRST